MTMIYFIEAVKPGHIKIGFTDKPMAIRLALLQTGNSSHLRVLGTTSGPKRHERQLLRQFSASHIRGEWFKPVPQLLELIQTETSQFLKIEFMDLLLGKKVTRYSIKDLVYSNGLFNWKGIIDKIARRLRAGEKEEQVAAACPLEIAEGCVYCGWVKARSRQPYRYHFLFFKKDDKLYRYSHRDSIKSDQLPRDVLKSLPSGPAGFRSVCSRIWEQAKTKWFNDENHLYL